MNDSKHTPPFKTLGTHLKYLREHISESVDEVSGAVEIEPDVLDRIERGVERPSEEILMLLISHFNMQDSEAVRLWELAGYDRKNVVETAAYVQEEITSGKPVVMLLAVDMRAQYTDGISVEINDAGAVMTFTQAAGSNHPQPVAKVGMSLQQAEAVSAALQRALLQARYGRPMGLPAPKNNTDI